MGYVVWRWTELGVLHVASVWRGCLMAIWKTLRAEGGVGVGAYACVCVVGRGEFVGDGVLKYIFGDAAAP